MGSATSVFSSSKFKYVTTKDFDEDCSTWRNFGYILFAKTCSKEVLEEAQQKMFPGIPISTDEEKRDLKMAITDVTTVRLAFFVRCFRHSL